MPKRNWGFVQTELFHLLGIVFQQQSRLVSYSNTKLPTITTTTWNVGIPTGHSSATVILAASNQQQIACTFNNTNR
eukprot:1745936-Amphidinium_carterae.1